MGGVKAAPTPHYSHSPLEVLVRLNPKRTLEGRYTQLRTTRSPTEALVSLTKSSQMHKSKRHTVTLHRNTFTQTHTCQNTSQASAEGANTRVNKSNRPLKRYFSNISRVHNVIIVLKALCNSVNTTLGYEGECYKMRLQDNERKTTSMRSKAPSWI